jgi:hypothetical protein
VTKKASGGADYGFQMLAILALNLMSHNTL